MRPLSSLIAVAGLPLVLALGPPPAAAASVTRGDRVDLDGVQIRVSDRTSQAVTVDHTRGHRATVSFWKLTDDGWERRLTTRGGRIGYGGLVRGDRRVQGTGTTPLGTYDLLSVFGTRARDAAWRLPYHRIRRGDHWVQDNRSRFYNRLRNQRQGGFRWWLPSSHPDSSERLTDYPRQYEWSIVTSFNRQQVRRRGSGIFLHVNGSGATAGCVSAPRSFVRALVRRLDPRRAPVIGIGR